MGLDMYLNKTYYVRNSQYQTEEERFTINILKGGKPSVIPIDKIVSVSTQEIYWRKANAIHNWFVQNVQNGNDDCGTYYVTPEQLQELLKAVSTVLENIELVDGKVQNGTLFEHGEIKPIIEDGKVIKDPTKADEVLPTTEGFFFGSTEYDQSYIEDLNFTKTELERILAVNDYADFEYHSSW